VALRVGVTLKSERHRIWREGEELLSTLENVIMRSATASRKSPKLKRKQQSYFEQIAFWEGN